MDNNFKILVDTLGLLLHNHMEVSSKDENNKDVIVNVKIYTDEQLLSYINIAMPIVATLLNAKGCANNENLLASFTLQYAFYLGLMSQSLPVKGRQFTTTDNGVTVYPPAIADHMMAVANSVLQAVYKAVEIL